MAAELIRAMGVVPLKPSEVLELGSETLLKMKMNDAVVYYDVQDYVPGKRIRVSTDDEREVVGAMSA